MRSAMEPGRRFRIKESDEWNFGGANHVVRDSKGLRALRSGLCKAGRTSGQPVASRKATPTGARMDARPHRRGRRQRRDREIVRWNGSFVFWLTTMAERHARRDLPLFAPLRRGLFLPLAASSSGSRTPRGGSDRKASGLMSVSCRAALLSKLRYASVRDAEQIFPRRLTA